MRLWTLSCALWVAAAPACAQLAQPKAQSPDPKAIQIARFSFAPSETTVSSGDTVVWTNDDALPHATTADSGAWSSPELRYREQFRFVARRVGRFPYHCSAHPVMRAVLIVRERRQ
jgi:plastocyanin